MKYKLKKMQYFRLISALCCVVVFLTAFCLSRQLAGMPSGQSAAERWKGSSDTVFAQVSAFARSDTEFSIQALEALHETIDEKLTAASLKAGSDSARLWYDAYSTQAGNAEITGTRRNPAEASVTAVGGDFFQLHAFRFVNGSYFSDSDLMQDRVVIDTILAWQLFGSSDVTGMELTIQNKICLVAGVIEPETDYASKTAYGDTPRIYISYDLYESGWKNAETDRITCYEVVLPNPVRGFAKKTLSEAVGEEDEFLFIQNTDRFSLSQRWETLRGIHKLLIPENIFCPYWENTARILSFDTAVLLLLEILFLIWPVIYFLMLFWKAYRLTEKTLQAKRIAYKNRYRSQVQI